MKMNIISSRFVNSLLLCCPARYGCMFMSYTAYTKKVTTTMSLLFRKKAISLQNQMISRWLNITCCKQDSPRQLTSIKGLILLNNSRRRIKNCAMKWKQVCCSDESPERAGADVLERKKKGFNGFLPPSLNGAHACSSQHRIGNNTHTYI